MVILIHKVELREVITEDDLDLEEEDIFDGEDDLNQADSSCSFLLIDANPRWTSAKPKIQLKRKWCGISLR